VERRSQCRLQLADNAHVLTSRQVEEIGHSDILLISPAKAKLDGREDATAVENIALLKPRLVVWAHHIVPESLPESDDSQILREYFKNYFKTNASTNRGYTGEDSFMSLCYVFENAIVLNQKYSGISMRSPTLEITSELLAEGAEQPKGILFRRMLAKSKVG
jgi:hypothetical protein